MILTVAIPTYNRPDKVKKTVERLIPQLTDNVRVLILDNCSEIDVRSNLQSTLQKSNVSERINIIRNKVNIGPDANFARCFELCETPYIWTLSDDDEIAEEAVKLILNEIDAYKDFDLIGFNFNSNCNRVTRDKPIIIDNIHDLSYKLDFFGNWLFMSTAVYKTQEYLKNIRFAIWSAYTMCSQIVPAMIAISNNKTFVLSEKYIVTNIPLEDMAQKWSNVQISLGLPVLLEAPVGFTKDEYRAFGQKMIYQLEWPADVLYCIINSINFDINLIDNYHLYLYRQNFWRTVEFRDKILHQTIQYYLGLWLLKYKPILKLMWKLFPRIQQKSKQIVPFKLFVR